MCEAYVYADSSNVYPLSLQDTLLLVKTFSPTANNTLILARF